MLIQIVLKGSASVQVMAWYWIGNNALAELVLMHICINRSQRVKAKQIMHSEVKFWTQKFVEHSSKLDVIHLLQSAPKLH